MMKNEYFYKMNKINFEIEFKNEDFSSIDISNHEFDRCTFFNCIFSGNNLRVTIFIDCLMDNCNFSSVKFNNTSLKNVDFIDSKLVGTDFSNANEFLFSINFKNCNLDFSNLYMTNLKKTQFIDCSLKEIDFSETNLTESILINCDLLGSVFENTNLSKSDLSKSINYTINPNNNNIKKAIFSYPEVIGLLKQFDIIIQ